MEDYRILNENAVFSNRLYPETQNVFQSEEDRHPWRALYRQTYEVPLLRIWDHYSGSQPDMDHSMKSREPEMRLDTYEKRRSSLAKHLDYGDWTPGPYISFTNSPVQIEGLVLKRSGRNRGPHTLTVIDPNKRIRMGLPILDVLAEMQSYKIPDPYGRNNQYYFGGHACLWKVTEAEIVGHFPWDFLEQKDNWYQDIIMPAFRKFTEQHRVKPIDVSIDALLHGFNNLSVGRDDSQSSGTGSANGNEYYCSDVEEDLDFAEGLTCRFPDEEYDWDTDDDVEEANAADDMIKMIEGDWR